MGELYTQVEREFERLRAAVEEGSGVDLSDIRLMPMEDYLKVAKQMPDFNELHATILSKSPILFSPIEGAVVANENCLKTEQFLQKGFDLRFYLLHELSHGFQWALGDFSQEGELEGLDARYAELRNEFREAPQGSEMRKELFPALESMLKEMGLHAKVLNTLKEGFAVYYQLECIELRPLDERLADYSRTMADALRIHAATGEDHLGMLLRGWNGCYSKGYDFFRRIVDLADGNQSVLQDIIRCSPTTMEEIENPQRYWEQRLKPYCDSGHAA